MKQPKDYILLYLKGLSMGATDVIPGVSGGSVALLTGIYGELVRSVRAIDRESFELLRHKRFDDFWAKINGSFLVTIFLALLTSLFTLARAVTWLLVHEPILTRAFFFGIISIAAPLILRGRKKWDASIVIAFFAGALFTYILSVVPPVHWPDNLLFIFLTGVVAIGGLMIPGISGAFLLLFLGKYKLLANALSTFDLPVLLVFLLGCLTGLMGFSRILSWSMDKYHNATLALLAGFMMGSLNKIWPWRQVIEFVTPNQGSQVPVHDKSILPWDFLSVTGKDPQLFQAILVMALGVFIVVLIEKITARLKTKI